MGITQPNGKTTALHLCFEIEDAKDFHAVGGDRILIVDDSDVAKPEGPDESLHNFVVRDRAGEFLLPLVSAAVLVLGGQSFGHHSQLTY